MKKSFGQIISNWLGGLQFRKEIPAELEYEFMVFRDIKSIDRLKASSWIAFFLTLCLLFLLDLGRYESDTYSQHIWYPWLFKVHLIGILFLVFALHITLHKKWIVQTRLRRGVVIWGMVVVTISFLLGQSILVYLDRGTTVMYLAYIFVGSWMFSMSHMERLLFNILSILIMSSVIVVTRSVMIHGTSEVLVFSDKMISFIEILFLSITAFLFDTFDFNLKFANFMNLREIEREKERVKKLEAFKSRFFTNLTHELRTPLTIISGMAREISEDAQRWAAEGSEIITRNAGNMLNLVNQILALSKIESGSLPLHMTQGDVVSYLGYVVDAFRGHALARRIKLHYLPEEDEIFMDYDPEKLMTILSNLLSNAIKFTPEDGNVYIHLTCRHLGEDSTLELTIRDTGMGIPEDELDHIFERFYQAQNEITGSGIGTGIGLSLVNELVKMLGGEIQVKSSLGKGATFSISLPLRTEAPIEGRPFFKEDIRSNINFYLPPVHERDVLTGLKEINEKPEVLILEDNPDVIKYLQICLSDLYKITCCTDGQSGVEKAIEMVPDLILSDVMMPHKDGLAVCRELKQHAVTSHIPIVLLSAKVDPESRIAGLESGADVYMLKPFEKQELRMQLHNLLERRQELHQRYANLTDSLEKVEDQTLLVEDQFVIRARAIVQEHLDDSEFSVTHFCRAIFLSRTQLHKKLTALTGLSASHFIRQIRLNAARDLLKNTSLSIADVAYKVGFTDPNYFTRCFGEEFGTNPSETRK